MQPHIMFSFDDGILDESLWVPDHMREPIRLYVLHGLEPGSFLSYVISNDLFGAIRTADATNSRHLKGIAAWFLNHGPDGCYGSREHLINWIKDKDNVRSNFFNEYQKALVVERLQGLPDPNVKNAA